MAVEFYKEFGEFGYLANYSNYGFYKNGVYYKTVEHYYQSEKYDDLDIKQRIINCATAKEAASIGRDRNNIRKNNFRLIKQDVILEGLLEKFRQNKDLMYKLIETRNEEIIEMTIDEYYWGIGKNRTGQNNIGKLLMKTREILKREIIDNIILKCKDKKIYIIGHNNPDADSIFSAYLLNNIFSNFGINSSFAMLNNDFYSSSDEDLIRDNLRVKPEIICVENNNFILVDHNTIGDIPKENVFGSFDHHVIANEVENIIEMERASTGLLLYDLFKDKYDFNEEEKKLILLTVLADTDYLHSTRFKEDDKVLFDELNSIVKLNIDEYKNKYFKTTDLSLSIEENINRNVKFYPKLNLHRVLITSNLEDDYEKLDNYIEYITKLNDKYLLIWANYNREDTYIYYDGKKIKLNGILTSTYKVLEKMN